MKVKPFRAPRVVMASLAEGRTLLRESWRLWRAGRLFALGVFLGALGIGALIWPYDVSLLETVHFWHGGRNDTARSVAWWLGTWGDYPTYNVPLALMIWLYGLAVGSRAWRRVAIVAFLGATLAGGFDDCFRLTLGRPRPDSHLADRFYGLAYAMRGGFQSFPSGHAAAVFGTAVALLMTDLPLGILTTGFALAVVWARMELYRHYPSDVAVGTIIGIYFGWLVGAAARARRRQPPPSAG